MPEGDGFRHHPLVPIASAFAAGILLAESLPQRPVMPAGLLLAASCLIAACFMRRRELLATALVLLAWLGLGAARWALQKGQSSDPRLSRVPNYGRVILAGNVDSPRKPGKGTQPFVVRLRAIHDSSGWHPARGRVRVFAPDSLHARMHDDLLFAGYLVRPLAQRNPGAFNRLRYEQAHGVQALVLIRRDGWLVKLGHSPPAVPLRLWAYAWQQRLSDRINRIFPEPMAPLLRGLLLGLRASLPEDTIEAFARSGVIHILAVSGLHVGFVLLIFWGMASLLRLPRRPFTLFVFAGIWLYAWVTGMKPPVIRAATMASLFLLARLLDRPVRSENLLAAAGLLLLAFRPGDVFLIGFQLSFAAVAGILYFYPRFKSLLHGVPPLAAAYRHRALRYLLDLSLVSMAAQLGTLPFAIAYFGRVSLVALLSNLIVVPAVFVLVCLAFLALSLSVLSPGVTAPLATLAGGLGNLILWSTAKIASWPLASIDHWQPPWEYLLLAYLAFLLLLEWQHPRRRMGLILGILIIANVTIWQAVLQGDRWLRITFFDVGQGDAALLEFPTGRTLLIDAGPLRPTDTGERILSPALRRRQIRSLDAVLLTHPHADHIGGMLSLIKTVDVRKILVADTSYPGRLFREILTQARQRHIQLRIVRRGQVLDDFAPAQVWIMGPSPADARRRTQLNHASLLVKVVYGQTTFLFTGDTERQGEMQSLAFANLLQADVLKVGHHGSRTSSSAPFLAFVRPQWSVLSYAGLNRYGFPDSGVVRRLNGLPSQVVGTAERGAVMMLSDGKRIVLK